VCDSHDDPAVKFTSNVIALAIREQVQQRAPRVVMERGPVRILPVLSLYRSVSL
jgi:hypothetical protein